MKKALEKKKVFVGLSGGVDSSVSAALLKSAGHDVVGVFIKVWQPDFLECTWIDDRRDAMRIAAALDIPFMTMDLGEEYKSLVVDYMIREYRAGRTPNPDVMCNKEIKFGAFMKKALEMGADFVATGHYARVENTETGPKLFMGADKNKDQSYFLWSVQREKLSQIMFPIGSIEKQDVRKLASKFNLITASKKDSQGLCFIGKLDMADFLKRFIKEEPGKVVNETGEIIGSHDGAFYLTLGQRHGFKINKKGINDKPLYIVAKDIEKNTITVSAEPKGSKPTNIVELESINWIDEPHSGEALSARARYRQTLKKCTAIKDGTKWTFSFEEPDIFARGQSLVVYRGEECLGGGIIV